MNSMFSRLKEIQEEDELIEKEEKVEDLTMLADDEDDLDIENEEEETKEEFDEDEIVEEESEDEEKVEDLTMLADDEDEIDEEETKDEEKEEIKLDEAKEDELDEEEPDLDESDIEESKKEKKGILGGIFAKKEEPEEDYDDYDDYYDYDDEDLYSDEEEIEEKPKKVGIFTRIKNFFTRKNNIEEPDLTEEELASAPNKEKSKIGKFFSKIKSIFKPNKYKKIKKFVNKYHSDNEEVKSFMDLLDEREDKDEIVDYLYDCVKYLDEAKEEEEFLNMLYEAFNMSRKEDTSGTVKEPKPEEVKEPEVKVEEPKKEIKVEEIKIEEPKKEINAEKIKIEEPKKEIKETKKVTKVEELKKVRDITKLNSKYIELKNELHSKFTKEEIMFIEDAHSECLELGDQEFDQMLNERCIDKRRIYAYLLNLEKIKLLSIYENLDKYEKMFIKDAWSECLESKDQEYDQMIAERNIDKDVILQYSNALKQSMERQNKIKESYKKEFLKMNEIDLSTKKVSELKEIAKENDVKVKSKMKKQELIDALNKLKEMKEEEAYKRLNLTK